MGADNTQRDEQDLERYGVWVKTGPDDAKPRMGSGRDLMGLEDSDDENMLITDEEEILLGNLDLSAPAITGELDNAFAANLPEEEFAPAEMAGTDFDPVPEGGESDSKVLFKKIEGEISSLREEIRALKDELSGLRVPGVAAQADLDSGGFFEDEDDETIALTGDELDNILDSTEPTDDAVAFVDDDAGVEISQDEIEDIGAEITDVDFDEVFDTEMPDQGEDFSLSVVGSPPEPAVAEEDRGDPEIIEIDIPGLDETVAVSGATDLPEEPSDGPVVSIDDFAEDFEEITDLDSIIVDSDSPAELQTLDDIREEVPEPSPVPIAQPDIPAVGDVFDEGEEVEIDFGDDFGDDLDDGGGGIPERQSPDLEVQMEEVSLEDLGIDSDEPLPDQGEGGSDVLAVNEDLNLDAYINETDETATEDLDSLDAIMKESGEQGDAGADATEIELDDLEEFAPPEGSADEGLGSGVLENVLESVPETAMDDTESVEELDSPDEGFLDVDEFEELELESESDSDEISVTVPDDGFGELPGTEAVDLDSLEALAGAPDLSEEATDEFVELPAMDLGEEPGDALADLSEMELGEAPGDELADLAEMELGGAPGDELAALPEMDLGEAPGDELIELPEMELGEESGDELTALPEMDLGEESGDELTALPEMDLGEAVGDELVELPEMELGEESGDELTALPEMELGEAVGDELADLGEMDLGEAVGDELADLGEMDLGEAVGDELADLGEMDLGEAPGDELVELPEMELGDESGDELTALPEMDLGEAVGDELVELPEMELGEESGDELTALPEMDLGEAVGDELADLTEMDLGESVGDELVELPEMELGEESGDELTVLPEMDLGEAVGDELADLGEMDLGESVGDELVELPEMELGEESGDELTALPEMELGEVPGDELTALPEMELGEAPGDELTALPEMDLGEAVGDELADLPEMAIETDTALPDEDLVDPGVDLPDVEIEVDSADDEGADALPPADTAPNHAVELPELDGDVEQAGGSNIGELPPDLKDEIKDVLKYMDQLLESLPDQKIQEFARSEHFEIYKKIFEELGISD